MVFVEHDRDLPVADTQDHVEVPPDQHAETFFRIGDATHRVDHLFFGDVHGVAHDVEEDLVFALKMVVEATLAQLESGGDVVHGSRVVTALLKKAGGGPQDFLTGVDQGLADHEVVMVNTAKQNANWGQKLGLDIGIGG